MPLIPTLLTELMKRFVSLCRWAMPWSHRLTIDRVTLTVPAAGWLEPDSTYLDGSPRVGKTIRIVQLSDFHYQIPNDPNVVLRIFPDLLEELVARVNAENADIIVLTGDFVQKDPTPITELVNKYLVRMKSKYGSYAVNGNHCNKTGPQGRDHVLNELRRGGIRVLFNERCSPLPGLDLAGLGDVSIISDFNPERTFESANHSDQTLRIVLSHNPDTARKLRDFPGHIQLSGHTHGGQVHLPFGLGPLISYVQFKSFILRMLPAKIRNRIGHNLHIKWRWVQGLHRVSKQGTDWLRVPNVDEESTSWFWLYVNRGLATHPPLRFLCPPEMTVLTIKDQ